MASRNTRWIYAAVIVAALALPIGQLGLATDARRSAGRRLHAACFRHCRTPVRETRALHMTRSSITRGIVSLLPVKDNLNSETIVRTRPASRI
jgi:hypothetical protein